MAMAEIRKAVRELIRVTMRERGIKHSSTSKEICTVCYAENAINNIEYEGPVFINYDEPLVHIYVYHSHNDLEYRYPGTNWSKRNPEKIIDTTAIDVHDPNFCEILGAFIDKHIPHINRRPSRWKQLYLDTDKKYYYITSSKSRTPTYRGIFHWIKRKILRIDPHKHDWYWEQAVKRHFHTNDKELENITNTVHALIDFGEKNHIKTGTKMIIEGKHNEYHPRW